MLLTNSTMVAKASTVSISISDEPVGAAEPIGLDVQTPNMMPEITEIPVVATKILEQPNQYSNETGATDSIAQVTSVSHLSDVQPTDWAFQALQSFVERYGCIAGYPDSSYRGNRALTRYEFAAGLNACLNRVNELIATATTNLVRTEDLNTLQRLQEEFAAELATLKGRVDAVEARAAELEANQFSTTTKLIGEVIFTIADTFGDVVGQDDDNTETIFAERVRLNFDTSFTGKDLLRTRLQARNIIPFSGSDLTGTNMTRLLYDGNENNDVFVSKLEYRFPLGSRTVVYLEATGGTFFENMLNFNPLFFASGSGAISRFGAYNPIYWQNAGGAGITANYNFSKELVLSLGYLTSPGVADNPAEKFGLFNGGYAALAQLAFLPSDVINFGLTYMHSYNNSAGGVSISGSTGSAFANTPFGNVATSSNHYGVQATFKPIPNIVLSGWAGYTVAIAEDSSGAVTRGDNAKIWNWAVTLGLTDFGSEGSLLGLIFGMPPKVTDNDFGDREDDDTSYHLEVLYRFNVTDHLAITPGVFIIFNPEHSNNNDNIYVGAIRATFTF